MILAANTVAFAIAFAAWVALGPAARVVGADLELGAAEITWLQSLPVLVGSVFRLPAGILADRVGARTAFPALMWTGAAGLLGMSMAHQLGPMVLGALAVGVVGATFAVGVQSVSASAPAHRSGVALGIFGAANIGSALTTFGLPLLIGAVGWRDAMRAYAAILVAAGLAYAAAVGSPATTETSLRGRLAPLWRVATWRDGLYYMATFGGFVAVTLLATDLYVEVHGLSLETAGAMATTFTLSSSLARVPGGWLADRLGGDHVLRVALGTIALSLAPLAMASSLLTTVCLVFVAGLAMGVGMAAVYQRIPGRFPTGVGAAGGAVGALGGLAGFYLPLVGSWAGSPLLPVGALAALALLTHIAWERPTR